MIQKLSHSQAITHDDDDDADDNDGTKNNMSPRGGGRHNFHTKNKAYKS